MTNSEHEHEGPMDENGDPIMPADGDYVSVNHSISESADKIRVDTKVKRGTDTRDQDEIKVQVKGDEPKEVVTKLNETVARLQGTSQNLRDMNPERSDND